MRVHAAANSARVSARMTPRLAESTSGLSTHGKRARAATACGSSVMEKTAKPGWRTPPRASASRMACLFRVALTAESALARSPSAWPMAAPTTVVASSTGTTAATGRVRA